MPEVITIGGSIVATVGGILRGFSGGNKPIAATQEQIDAASEALEPIRERRVGTPLEGFEGVGLGAFGRFALTQLSNVVPDTSPKPEPPKRVPRDPERRPGPFPKPRRGPGRGTERRRPRIKLPIPKQLEVGARVFGVIFEKIREPQREAERQRRERNREAKEDEEIRKLDKRKQEILEEIERRRIGDPPGRTETPPRVSPRPQPGQPTRTSPGQPRDPGRAPARPPEMAPGTRPATGTGPRRVPGIGVPGTLRAPVRLPSTVSRPGTAPKITFAPGPQVNLPGPKILPPTAGPTISAGPSTFQSFQTQPQPRTRQRRQKCEKKKPKRPRKTCREGFFEETPTNTTFTTWRKVDCRTRKEKKGSVSRRSSTVDKTLEKALRRIPRGVIPIDLPI